MPVPPAAAARAPAVPSLAPRVQDTGASLVRRTLLGLLGQGLPLVIAFGCLRVVVERFGVERFGVLALAWAVLGAVAAFDLGLGRAATWRLSSLLGTGTSEDVGRVVGTALAGQVFLGVIGGALVAAAAPALVTRAFDVPPALQAEAVATLRITGLVIPLLLIGGVLQGALYAAGQYGAVHAVLVPASSSNYLLALLAALVGWPVPVVVGMIAVVKAATVWALWRAARHRVAGLSVAALAADRETLVSLLRFGSWLTLSSLVAPILKQAERLLIPALLSVGALAVYTVPYDALTRGTVLPTSMAQALFPAFSRSAMGDAATMRALVVRPVRYLLILTTPIFTIVALFARQLLTMWMGADFAAQASGPVRILAVAFYFLAFANVLRPALQGLGRPDMKAGLDIGIAVVFLVLLRWLTPWLALEGAALARLAITLLEIGGLLVLARQAAPEALSPGALAAALRRDMSAAAAMVTLAVAVVILLPPVAASAAMLAIVAGYLVACWVILADATDRQVVRQVGRLLRGTASA